LLAVVPDGKRVDYRTQLAVKQRFISRDIYREKMSQSEVVSEFISCSEVSRSRVRGFLFCQLTLVLGFYNAFPQKPVKEEQSPTDANAGADEESVEKTLSKNALKKLAKGKVRYFSFRWILYCLSSGSSRSYSHCLT